MRFRALLFFELQVGALKTYSHDAQKARDIERWIDDFVAGVTVIPLSGPAAREAARLLVGLSLDLLEDAMIAATARVHNLTVATRNTRDFELFGVPVVDPFLFPRE